MSFLDDRPPEWSGPEWQEFLNLLVSSIYRGDDIERLLNLAGVAPGDVRLDGTARNAWMDALRVAGGKGRTDELVVQIRTENDDLSERLDELLAAKPPIRAPGPEKLGMSGFNGTERQIVAGDDTLLDIAFLERGLERAASVCRFTSTFGANRVHGSGFRIGSDLLLTNHHVVHDWDGNDARATAVEVLFDYENDVTGARKRPEKMSCDVASIVADKLHDWAVIKVEDPIPDRYPIIELVEPTNPVVVGDRVYIIQHPEGMRKKIGLHHNLVRHVDDDLLQYWTDTAYGSSGSPVFNREWQVVGLHHFWITTPDETHSFANQGRRIERVMEGIGAVGI